MYHKHPSSSSPPFRPNGQSSIRSSLRPSRHLNSFSTTFCFIFYSSLGRNKEKTRLHALFFQKIFPVVVLLQGMLSSSPMLRSPPLGSPHHGSIKKKMQNLFLDKVFSVGYTTISLVRPSPLFKPPLSLPFNLTAHNSRANAKHLTQKRKKNASSLTQMGRLEKQYPRVPHGLFQQNNGHLFDQHRPSMVA